MSKLSMKPVWILFKSHWQQVPGYKISKTILLEAKVHKFVFTANNHALQLKETKTIEQKAPRLTGNKTFFSPYHYN